MWHWWHRVTFIFSQTFRLFLLLLHPKMDNQCKDRLTRHTHTHTPNRAWPKSKLKNTNFMFIWNDGEASGRPQTFEYTIKCCLAVTIPSKLKTGEVQLTGTSAKLPGQIPRIECFLHKHPTPCKNSFQGVVTIPPPPFSFLGYWVDIISGCQKATICLGSGGSTVLKVTVEK